MINTDVTWQSLGTMAQVLDWNINLVLPRLGHQTLTTIIHPALWLGTN
jgi:hypothetical protein